MGPGLQPEVDIALYNENVITQGQHSALQHSFHIVDKSSRSGTLKGRMSQRVLHKLAVGCEPTCANARVRVFYNLALHLNSKGEHGLDAGCFGACSMRLWSPGQACAIAHP
ncbi:hypothetical protein HaLaN_17370 [Haematococcus lacustris]|uniref:Uncharacterized protein n=1 Tax=Haematococcus lacustris TaxID=44745 RepID=A0A699ZC54_HAELA|nr:hypothetical protein HaLaN_17370 [Haematococcus lacustris]